MGTLNMKTWAIIILLLSIALPTWSVDYTDDPNCRGAWLFEATGDEVDVSAMGETLTETSGTIALDTTNEKFGSGCRFIDDGDTEYFAHADGGESDVNGANFSAVLWYRPDNLVPGYYHVLMSKWNGSGANQQTFMFRSGGTGVLQCFISSDGAAFPAAVPANSSSNYTWTHLGVVYNKTDLRIYVNGSLSTNGASNPLAHTTGLFNSTASFAIGCDFANGSPGNYANGEFDEAAIFNRSLTAGEVADICTNGLGYVAPGGAINKAYYRRRQ